MASCAELLSGIEGTCEAIKLPGGYDKRVWIGITSDLDSATFTANKNEVTAITFKATKGLKTFVGRNEKHTGSENLEVGENINLFLQELVLGLYVKTATERASLDTLKKVNDNCLFVIIETNAGQLEVWGLNMGTNFDNFGLKPSAGAASLGVVLNDSRVHNVTLSGKLLNSPILYNEAVAIATSIAALDALVV
jgi:hypothetical protein